MYIFDITYFDEIRNSCSEDTLENAIEYARVYYDNVLRSEEHVGRIEIKYEGKIVAYQEFTKEEDMLGEYIRQHPWVRL